MLVFKVHIETKTWIPKGIPFPEDGLLYEYLFTGRKTNKMPVPELVHGPEFGRFVYSTVGIGRFDWNCASCSAVVFTKKQNDEDEDDDEVQERKR